MRLLLALSLMVNLAIAGFLVYRWATRPPPDRSGYDYRESRVTLLRVLSSQHELVLLGDSLTDWGEWPELLGRPVANRGIAGDTTEDVRARLGDVLATRPKTIAMMVGVNDLLRGGTEKGTGDGVLALVEEIRKQAPGTRLLVQSLLPVRAPGDGELNARIARINARLAEGATAGGYRYLDIAHALRGTDGRLEQRFTLDGLHLSGEGYRAWAGVLGPAL